LNIHKNTAQQVIHKYETEGSVKDRAGRGRKRKISHAEENLFVKRAKKGKYATDIAREYSSRTRTPLHPQTVRNILSKTGLRHLVIQEVEALTEDNRGKRLTYATKKKKFNWQNVLFSDEKTFQVGAGLKTAWQDPKKRQTRKVFRHPKKLHVWAGAGYFMKCKLFCFGNFTGQFSCTQHQHP